MAVSSCGAFFAVQIATLLLETAHFSFCYIPHSCVVWLLKERYMLIHSSKEWESSGKINVNHQKRDSTECSWWSVLPNMMRKLCHRVGDSRIQFSQPKILGLRPGSCSSYCNNILRQANLWKIVLSFIHSYLY